MENSYLHKQKKVITFKLRFTTILILCCCASFAQAASVGSPAGLLKKGQWDFTVEGGYISERPMEVSGAGDYHVTIYHGYHSRSYGLTDRLMLTAKVGGTYGYLYDDTAPDRQSKTSLSGGLGLGAQLKGIIFQNEALGFQWDGSGQFLHIRSHHKRSGKANADWYEWQASTSLAKSIGRFKPYAGVKYSVADLEHDDGKGSKTSYDEDGSVGPFLGIDIYLGQDKDIIINLEAGLVLGTEFYGGLKYRF